ncbi:hypothetical protein [Actinoallomurus sp. NPDC052274]|uniref:hypothetical protein n=1 Tax=Actinoallomurus sp. NPDC052274 TaxID=3155420 RepID=UPI00341C7FC7
MRQPDPRHEDGNQVVFLVGDDECARPLHTAADRIRVRAGRPGALRKGGVLMQPGGPPSGKHFLFQG